MLIVLSPAKSLDYETLVKVKKSTLPDFVADSAKLIADLKTLSPQAVAKLMSLSDPLAALNVGRFRDWSTKFTEKNSKPAIFAFNGDVYEGFDAASLNSKAIDFAQDHVRILSGLYGLLRPLDLMQPYRLEMGTAFKNARGKDLYAFWGDRITSAVKQQLTSQKKNPFLLNLASEEYFKVLQPKELGFPVIAPVFQDAKDGKYKIISFYAKRARGLMARFAVENRITDPADLRDFNLEGYRFSAAESKPDRPVFRRAEKNNMTVHRSKSSQRASPEAERLVADAISLAASGSQIEDRFWEGRLSARLLKLMTSQNQNVIDAALDQTFRINTVAFEVLADCAETLAESQTMTIDQDGWDVLLLALPIVAHTRYQIQSGPLPVKVIESVALAMHSSIAANDTRLAIVPWLYSIDQMPHSHCQTRILTEALGTAAITASEMKLELRNMSETIAVLADPRFIIAAIAAPSGSPLFRWQAEPPVRQERGVSLIEWQTAMREPISSLLPGCEFDLLLPEAYFTNCRLADKQVRPLSIRAAVNFLETAVGAQPNGLSCVIGAFGEEQVDEYRISFSLKGSPDVMYGVIWPMYDRETVSNDALNDINDDESPIKKICDALKEAGVEDVFRHAVLFSPELCDDCGAPLFPDRHGEVVHAEMPEDTPTQQPLFH